MSPSSSSPSKRRSILNFLTGSPAKASNKELPTRSPPVSVLQLLDDNQTTSSEAPDDRQSQPAAALPVPKSTSSGRPLSSRLSSPSLATGGKLFKKTPSNSSLKRRGSRDSAQEASADRSDGRPLSRAASLRPTSPTKQVSSSQDQDLPSIDRKSTRGMLLPRMRRNSSSSIASSFATSSRPASPTKSFGLSSSDVPPSPKKGHGIDKSSIGLPTNFRHASGVGTTLSLEDAIELPGLLNGQELSQDADPQQLGNVQSSQSRETVNDSPVKVNEAGQDWVYSPDRLDTVKEVPSGFIRTLEAAEAAMEGRGHSATTSGLPVNSSSRAGGVNGYFDDGQGQGTTSAAAAAIARSTSPSLSPRTSKRKPVPRATPVQPQTTVSPEDWQSTLAEITSALQATAPPSSRKAGKVK